MKIALAVLLALASTAAAYGDSLVTTRPAGTDSVDWGQLGGAGTAIPQNFTFTTTDGVSGNGSFAGGTGEVAVQGNNWAGNFSSGNILAWTSAGANGPLTLSFGQGYTQIGAQIQADFFGAFTAQICDVATSTCFTEDGTSNSDGDGSAIYIGISSSTPITEVTFSLTSASFNPADFAINEVTLNSSVAATPEPGGFALLGTGLLGAAAMARRRLRI